MSRPRLGRDPFPDHGSGKGGVSPQTEDGWEDYDFAVVRAVPHVHVGTYENVGVVVHARRIGFLEARVVTDEETLAAMVPGVDHALLSRYLLSYEAIAKGLDDHGPVALRPPSERFHWLTAPRSDVLQCSEIHGGRSRDLEATLRDLFETYVAQEGTGGA